MLNTNVHVSHLILIRSMEEKLYLVSDLFAKDFSFRNQVCSQPN